MRLFSASIVGMAIALAVFSSAQAETYLVRGSLNNGDFNAGDPGFPFNRNFTQTSDWTNIGAGGDPNQTATDVTSDANGTHHAVLFDQPIRSHGLDTGYTIQAGDTFNTSYLWRSVGALALNADEVGVSLFTTNDDTISGTRSTLVTNQSGAAVRLNRYKSQAANSFYTAQPADVGKRLFVEIDGIDGNATPDFAAVDSFELSVGQPGIAKPILEFDAAKNPTNGSALWKPNIDVLESDPNATPSELFTFASTTSATAVSDPSVPGITASYSAGSQGRNYFDGVSNVNGPNFIGANGHNIRRAPVSIEVWFKPDNLTGGDQVLAEFGGSGNGSYISLQNDVLKFHNTSTLDGGGAVTLTAPALSTAAWTQVVATWEAGGNEAKLYVNGVLVDSDPNATLGAWSGGNAFGLGQVGFSDSATATDDLAINGPLVAGGAGELGLYPFAGDIAILRLYDRALDDVRVTAAYELITTTPGDFDGNGVVDGLDFLEWQRNPGVGDLADWEANYGAGGLAAATAAVPEPSSVVLLALMAAAGAIARKRRIDGRN